VKNRFQSLPFKCELQRYSAAEKAESALMEAATIKAEKKALAAHAKLDDDNSVSRIAQHTKQLNFLKVGLCTLNQVDPQPITYSLSNPQPITY
jgi:hypothetical protein